MKRGTEKFDGRVLELLLISRRRFAMSGSRFNARGIDDNSNVANFVETELIVTYEHNLYSFLQIRGSIPIFWEQKQKNLSHRISIKRSEPLTSVAFEGHLNDIV